MVGSSVGVVVIGRNEGERLRACLASLQDSRTRVYVDSGSTDGSRELARSLGFEVVELAVPPGFTAARARNAGIARLVARMPDLAYVQTVDGDCEVRAGWLERARAEMEADPKRAVVFGRRRERHPAANAYHLACDDEWDVPTGAVNSCGGDALFRLAALREVEGYNPALIAGEEPDLCLRLRLQGWHIWSNGQEMTWHDVAMGRFAQWWRRSTRTGYAIAELVRLHGSRADPAWRRLLRSALGWSVVSALAIAAVPFFLIARGSPPAVLTLLAPVVLAIQVARLAIKQRRKGATPINALRWAGLMLAAKAAQVQGALTFHAQRLRKRETAIIEYKR